MLDVKPDDDEEEDGAAVDLDAQRKGKCVVLKTTTRQTIFLPVVGLVDADKLRPGDLVGVNKDSYLILDTLPAEYDSRVKAMEVDEKPTEDYTDVGGLDKQIQELVEAVVLPIQHKDRFKALGIRPPKGVLLYGPPGAHRPSGRCFSGPYQSSTSSSRQHACQAVLQWIRAWCTERWAQLCTQSHCPAWHTLRAITSSTRLSYGTRSQSHAPDHDRAPSHLLIVWIAGTGKTLIARAVAAQTNAAFLKLAGPQLVQMFIGDGAKMVRDAFALAKEKNPCIIFIDEIDAIGTKRFDSELSGDRWVVVERGNGNCVCLRAGHGVAMGTGGEGDGVFWFSGVSINCLLGWQNDSCDVPCAATAVYLCITFQICMHCMPSPAIQFRCCRRSPLPHSLAWRFHLHPDHTYTSIPTPPSPWQGGAAHHA